MAESFIPEEFYDIIIDLDSMKRLECKEEDPEPKEGVKIMKTEKGWKTYESNKKKKLWIVGVIGQVNRGKSTILSEICNQKLPVGYSVHTKGISIKYPETKHEGDQILIIDTEGTEIPLTSKKGDIELSELRNLSKEEKREMNNKIFDIAIDKNIRQLFLQQFVINKSDKILIVVGQLTFTEQKAICNIRKTLENTDKDLIVVHNLMKWTKNDQIEEYLINQLGQLLTNKLELKKMATKPDKKPATVFLEKFKRDNKEIIINHVIMGNNDPQYEVYKEYTEPCFEFLKLQLETVHEKHEFDIIEEVKDQLVTFSKNALNKPIDKEKFNTGDNAEYLKYNGDIELKRCLIDELGYSNFFGQTYDPKYSYYFIDKEGEHNQWVIEVEIDGKCSNTKAKVSYSKESTMITISAIQNFDVTVKKENLIKESKRETGDFTKFIVFEEKFKWNEKPAISRRLGVLKVIFDIKKEEISSELKVEDKDVTTKK